MEQLSSDFAEEQEWRVVASSQEIRKGLFLGSTSQDLVQKKTRQKPGF